MLKKINHELNFFVCGPQAFTFFPLFCFFIFQINHSFTFNIFKNIFFNIFPMKVMIPAAMNVIFFSLDTFSVYDLRIISDN